MYKINHASVKRLQRIATEHKKRNRMSVTARKSEAKIKNVPMTKELITTWVKRDIETLYSLAYEMLSTPGVIEILSEKLYQRAKAEQEKAELEASRQIEADENV